MIQLELFPEKQILVFLRFTVIAREIRLDVQGPGLEIDSYWHSWDDIVVCFPILSESVVRAKDSVGELVATIGLSEKEWDYWSHIGNWTDQTRFYWSQHEAIRTIS